jgi:hypothetical protein
MVESAADGPGDELAIRRLVPEQFRVRVGNPVDPLVDSPGVEPASVLGQDGPKLSFVPHQDSVEQFTAQGADETLDMGLRVRCVVGSGESPDSHHIGQPYVEGRAAGDLLATDFDRDRLAELPEDAVVVVDQELRLTVEGSVSNLLPYPGLSRVPGDVDVDDLAAAELHDDEDVERLEANGLLDAEVAHPDGIGLVLEEGSPGLSWPAGSCGPDHVLADGGGRVLDAEFQLQFEGDAVFTVLGMVSGDAPDVLDMVAPNSGTPTPAIPTLAIPELPKQSPLPTNDRVGFDDDESCAPVRPDAREQGPEEPVPVTQRRAWILPPVDDELLAKGEVLGCQASPAGDQVQEQTTSEAQSGHEGVGHEGLQGGSNTSSGAVSHARVRRVNHREADCSVARGCFTTI